MRGLILLFGVAVTLASCDRIRSLGGTDEADPQLALSLEMSDVLDWGGVSDVELTLTNQGAVPATDINVELYFPSWMEFSSVQPENTEVALLNMGEETRLTYGLGSPPLQPGETRTIVQSVRVPPRGAAANFPDTAIAASPGSDTLTPAAPAPAGTAGAMPPAVDSAASGEAVPSNRTLRARLVWDDGEQLGAEVRTLMPFMGADNSAALPTAGATQAHIESEGVGPVRLGAAVADVRMATPSARDTTLTIYGSEHTGLVVPLSSGAHVLVSLVNGGVDLIMVRDAGVQTELGHGIGSTFQQLRQAYGNHCTQMLPDGRVGARFGNLRGVTFIFDGPAPAVRDTTAAASMSAIPEGAQVRELWVQRGAGDC